MPEKSHPRLLILNQMAGPMTWELAEDLGKELGCVALLTGHPDTLAKGSTPQLLMQAAPAYQRGSFARRAISWLQYMLAAFIWLWRFPKETPILLFSNPPILVWLGWIMRLLRGQPYAVMVHDIYPDVLVRLQGMPESHLLIRAWRWLNRRAYQRAQVVMTLGEYMAENLACQFDPARTPDGKVEVVYPWVDTDRIKPMPKEDNWFAQKYNQVGKLTVMYSGNMGLGHDIETMVEAARLLCDEKNIQFMFIGSGPKWCFVEEFIKREGLKNVTLLGWQKEEVLPYSLACADVTLVSLEPGIEGVAIPSKAIYALSTGSWIITIANSACELGNWLKSNNCGEVSVPADNELLATRLLNFNKNAVDHAKNKHHCREISEKLFAREKNAKLLIGVAIVNFATGQRKQ